MNTRLNLMVSVAIPCLCGCPLGTPNDHHRPHGHQDTSIDVSPTGDAILFNATGTGGRDLYLLGIEDLSVTRIAETPEYEVWPSFSPDGKELVYAAGIPGDRADHIFKRPTDGGPAEQLTHADANDLSPKFSPDGSMIVFARDKTYSWGGLAANWDLGGVICLVQSDGTNERQLTGDGTFAFDPHFSADGQTIIFSTPNGREVISVDGSSSAKAIAGPPGAVPSPDEELIAYTKGQYSPDLKLYAAKPDGSSERLLTPEIGGVYRPAFDPDGNSLFFLQEEWPSGPTGVPKFSLWETDIEEPSPRQVTDYQLFDAPLEWTPKTAGSEE